MCAPGQKYRHEVEVLEVNGAIVPTNTLCAMGTKVATGKIVSPHFILQVTVAVSYLCLLCTTTLYTTSIGGSIGLYANLNYFVPPHFNDKSAAVSYLCLLCTTLYPTSIGLYPYFVRMHEKYFTRHVLALYACKRLVRQLSTCLTPPNGNMPTLSYK